MTFCTIIIITILSFFSASIIFHAYVFPWPFNTWYLVKGHTYLIHRRFSTILKTSNKSVCSNDFWYVKVYTFWKFIPYTRHWDGTQMLKNFLRTKETLQKMHSFLLQELQLITVLLLICNSFMSWSAWFIFPKLSVGFSIFDSVPFLYFCSTKSTYSLTLKRHISFQNHNKWKATELWFLSCNKFENPMTSALSCSSPKIGVETNLLNLENRSFKMKSHFLSIATFKVNIWHYFT